MDTELLISKIVEEGAKKPLAHPLKQTALWLAGTLTYVLLFMVYHGLRPDLQDKLLSPLYILELAILALICISTAVAAFFLARPDVYQKSWIKIIPFLLTLPWLSVAYLNSTGPFNLNNLYLSLCSNRYDCPWHIAIFSIPPGIALFHIIQKAAPIQCCWAGTMSTWSVTSNAYMAMRLLEPSDNLSHLMIWHALPVLLMCMAGMVFGRLSLKWR